MRKAVAISFLLLANIVLLAHAFIPHHHHEGIPICFSSHKHNHIHDADDSDCTHPSHHEPGPGCTHSHHGGDCCPNDSCPISKDIYARVLEDDETFPIFDFPEGETESIFYVSNEDIIKLPIPGLYGLPFRQKPLLLSYFSEYIIGSLGLRGPPVQDV